MGGKRVGKGEHEIGFGFVQMSLPSPPLPHFDRHYRHLSRRYTWQSRKDANFETVAIRRMPSSFIQLYVARGISPS